MSQMLIGLLLPVAVGVGVSFFVGWFTKKFPKDDILQKYTIPIATKWADIVFFFGSRWLKPTDFDKLDEGIFKTVSYNLDGFIHTFQAELDSKIKSSEENKPN
jgi:ABC-type uncharacterized transport system permease subunit